MEKTAAAAAPLIMPELMTLEWMRNVVCPGSQMLSGMEFSLLEVYISSSQEQELPLSMISSDLPWPLVEVCEFCENAANVGLPPKLSTQEISVMLARSLPNRF